MEDLVKIIHIGETRARELISLRPFSSLNGLTKIKGVGELRLKDIKKEGLAWVVVDQHQAALQSKPELKADESALEFDPDSVNITSSSSAQEENEQDGPSKELQKNQSAAIGEQIPETFDSSSHIFLIALGLAVFSGITIVFLKKKLIKKV